MCAFSPILPQFYVPFYVKKKDMENFMCLFEFECAKRLKAQLGYPWAPEELISIICYNSYVFFSQTLHQANKAEKSLTDSALEELTGDDAFCKLIKQPYIFQIMKWINNAISLLFGDKYLAFVSTMITIKSLI